MPWIFYPRFFRFGLFAAIITIAADQLSKWYMLEVVDIDARPPIYVGPFLDLVMVWNRGVSFGMLGSDHPAAPYLLTVAAVAICLGLFHWLARAHSARLALALGLVIGGALGNVVDRIRFGAVADFFYFHWDELYWPAFNIADAAICVGVALLCIDSMLPPKHFSTPRDGSDRDD